MQKNKSFIVITFLILVTFFGGCQLTPTGPTPTPTRTPILPTATATPTATPTITPTPTPTLPPGLILPPQAAPLAAWPPLPNDLYFLQAGRIQCWLAEGGTLETIPVAPDIADNVDIIDYRVTQDKRYMVYLSAENRLYLFDRAEWKHAYVPTSGYLHSAKGTYFELSPDGNTLVYLAWGVGPTSGGNSSESSSQGPVTEAPFGTILKLDLHNPRKLQTTLGLCRSTTNHNCQGFMLSPDGTQLVYLDAQGLWQISLNQTEPKLVLPPSYSAEQELYLWPDNTHNILLKIQTRTEMYFSQLDLETATLTQLPSSECAGQCRLSASAQNSGLWVTKDSQEAGCLYKIQLADGDTPAQILYQICQAEAWSLHPTAPQTLPDGWVAFIHRGCGETCPGPAAGLYFFGPDERMHPIALLPEAEGDALWTKDGSAFLYFDKEVTAIYIGLTSGDGFWNLQEKLTAAHTFLWSP